MHDVANTFTERFLKAQLVFEPAPMDAFEPPLMPELPHNEAARPSMRYNALGILEAIPMEELAGEPSLDIVDAEFVEGDVGADRAADGASSPSGDSPARVVAQGVPQVVGAGSIRSLGDVGGSALPPGWEQTARNDACPCGSGKKFKKCHGANV